MAKNITIKAKFVKPKKRNYNATELRKGIRVEKEHSPNKRVRSTIAKNHMDEDSDYYKKLANMARKGRRKKRVRH